MLDEPNSNLDPSRRTALARAFSGQGSETSRSSRSRSDRALLKSVDKIMIIKEWHGPGARPARRHTSADERQRSRQGRANGRHFRGFRMKFVPAKATSSARACPLAPRDDAYHHVPDPQPKSIKRQVMRRLRLVVAGFGLWASTALITGAIVANGPLSVATGQNKIVQHLEGGMTSRTFLSEKAISSTPTRPSSVYDTSARATLAAVIRHALSRAKTARYMAEI